MNEKEPMSLSKNTISDIQLMELHGCYMLLLI